MEVYDSIMKGLQEAIDSQVIINNYHCVKWNDEKQIFILTFSDACGIPFKIKLQSNAIVQMIEDIEHGCFEKR